MRNNLLATQSMASLYYQALATTPSESGFGGDLLAKAEDWNKKVIALDPKNKEAYYTLGVIYWDEFLTPDRELRIADGMKLEERAPLKPDAKGKTAKADLKAKFWQPADGWHRRRKEGSGDRPATMKTQCRT